MAYRLSPPKSLAEHWEEIRQHPLRYLIPSLILLALITFAVMDLGLRTQWFSK
jgi:hypothetical protein